MIFKDSFRKCIIGISSSEGIISVSRAYVTQIIEGDVALLRRLSSKSLLCSLGLLRLSGDLIINKDLKR